MRKSRKLGLGLSTMLVLSGCTNPEFNMFGSGANRVDWAGARQMMGSEGEYFTAARVADMVNAALPGTENAAAPGEAEDGPEAVRRLDRAFANFANYTFEVGKNAAAASRTGEERRRELQIAQYKMRDARNSIQAQLIAASNNRCNVYKQHLTRFNTGVQFGLGSAATAIGGAGALLSGGATQAASALSGMLSGINAEFQKDFMSNVMTNVIVPGIDRQRADLRNDIVSKSCHGISEYPLPLAIAEVLRYHGACNVNVGIAASGQALTRTEANSLDAVLAAVRKAGEINKALASASAPPAKPAAAVPAAAGPVAPASSAAAAAVAAADTTPKASPPPASSPLLGENLAVPECPVLTPSGRMFTPATAKGDK